MSGERRAIQSYRHIRSPGGSGILVRLVPHLTLEVSEARMANLDLPVVQRSMPTGFPVHGLLGADLLMRCRTTVVRNRVRMEVIERG